MDTKKLRQKILDLAIRGKLVPQDPNDEPASVLLERIKAEKERLIKEGKIKRSKKTNNASDTPFRPTLPDDLERICTIIRQAQAQMRLRGSRQWQNGYPAAAHITDDIDRGYGHVLCTHTGLVVAYGAVVFDGEPAYAEIDGTWLDQAPYVVLHRLAVAQEVKGQGIATEFMRRTMTLARERGTGSFRIDTNFDNRCMLRLLAKFGFVRCGEIHYAGDPRIAFQKIL